MAASGHVADAHGSAGHEPNLTDSQFVVARADTRTERKLAYVRMSSILPGEVHVAPESKQTIATIGLYWWGNMFTGRSKAGTF